MHRLILEVISWFFFKNSNLLFMPTAYCIIRSRRVINNDHLFSCKYSTEVCKDLVNKENMLHFFLLLFANLSFQIFL